MRNVLILTLLANIMEKLRITRSNIHLINYPTILNYNYNL